MPHPTPTPHLLHGDEADLYRQHDPALRRVLQAKVTAPHACLEDARSFAWLQLLRKQPDRATVFPWLCTVAIREAWRLAADETRHAQVHTDPPLAADDSQLTVDAHDALACLADLPDRQRRYLTLIVAGHSYKDICRHTGASYPAVNKHLRRARAALRLVHDTDA